MRLSAGAIAAAASLAAMAAGCGSAMAPASMPEARHVHGLGLNPADGDVFVATHGGLFRLRNGRFVPVGDRVQDTMGFTVVGPNHFLGSGHPDFYKDPQYPPLLGLIESWDGGRNWSPRSMLGRADLHVLRARGRVVVGYDVSKRRILVSRDGGRSWLRRAFTGPLSDLVIDPGNPNRLIATSAAQLLISSDAGKTWRSTTETTGLLAWPARGRLYLLASDGRLWWSPDLGRRWQARGSIDGRPAAFTAAADRRLLAAAENGEIEESRDGGRTWRELAKLSPGRAS